MRVYAIQGRAYYAEDEDTAYTQASTYYFNATLAVLRAHLPEATARDRAAQLAMVLPWLEPAESHFGAIMEILSVDRPGISAWLHTRELLAAAILYALG